MFKLLCLLIMTVNISEGGSDEYIDPIIDLLLNGGNSEAQSSAEDAEGDNPILIGGIWTCGNCTNVDDSKLLYTEDNDVDVDMANDDVDIQIGLTLQDMRCVMVTADKPGVVRRLSGACDGATVTLHVAPARHFVVRVYN